MVQGEVDRAVHGGGEASLAPLILQVWAYCFRKSSLLQLSLLLSFFCRSVLLFIRSPQAA